MRVSNASRSMQNSNPCNFPPLFLSNPCNFSSIFISSPCKFTLNFISNPCKLFPNQSRGDGVNRATIALGERESCRLRFIVQKWVLSCKSMVYRAKCPFIVQIAVHRAKRAKWPFFVHGLREFVVFAPWKRYLDHSRIEMRTRFRDDEVERRQRPCAPSRPRN